MYRLAIGNQNYSSWSLRPWVLMRTAGIPFEEKFIPIYTDDGKAELHGLSEADKVPLLFDGDLTVWDSLAIVEYLADQHPELHLWPEGPADRALARSITAEMHSSFFEVRNQLPMNCRKQQSIAHIDAGLRADIDRICQIWRECRSQNSEHDNYLFGHFSIADAFYAPVVFRFSGYDIDVGEVEREYMDEMLALPAMHDWHAAATADTLVVPSYEID